MLQHEMLRRSTTNGQPLASGEVQGISTRVWMLSRQHLPLNPRMRIGIASMCFQQALASHAKAKLLVQNYQLKQLERAFADTHLATRLGLSSSRASAAHKFPMAVPNLHLAFSGKGAEADPMLRTSAAGR